MAAARAGVDAIGLIFHPGAPRNISIDRAAGIVAALPAFVTPVGLFVDAPIERICSTARRLGLRHIQLHGNETPADVDALSDFVVLKALRVERATFVQELSRWREAVDGPALQHLKGIVLESPRRTTHVSMSGASASSASASDASEAHAGEAGGTGVPNDWETVLQARARGDFERLPPVIAAGGLTPQTVGEVVRKLRPYAVDVSSGVERVRREKEPALIEAFVAAVREADGQR